MSSDTSLSDGHRCIVVGVHRHSDIHSMIFLVGGGIMAVVERVHSVVGMPTFTGIVRKSDNKFSTTSFVRSPTKISQNFDDRPSEISPECTSAKTL